MNGGGAPGSLNGTGVNPNGVSPPGMMNASGGGPGGSRRPGSGNSRRTPKRGAGSGGSGNAQPSTHAEIASILGLNASTVRRSGRTTVREYVIRLTPEQYAELQARHKVLLEEESPLLPFAVHKYLHKVCWCRCVCTCGRLRELGVGEYLFVA